MIPPMIQATKTSLTEPTARAISLLTRKIPDPRVSPITMAVADHKPRARIRSGGFDGSVRLRFDALTKVDRDYSQGFRWSIDFGLSAGAQRENLRNLWLGAAFTRYHRGRNGGSKIHGE